MEYDVVIVGGGMAGLTAAAYLSAAGQKTVLFDGQEKTGGLVQTFNRNGVWYDSGLRSIEDSGIVHPMLAQLGISLDLVKSPVSLGIGDRVLRLEGQESVDAFGNLLASLFPEHREDVSRIIRAIRKVMKHMDVLYGIENPAFKDLKNDREYLVKKVLPWIFRYLTTIGKIDRLFLPVDEYLQRLTRHQPLIDMIAQHFFEKTPTSFALSYFRLYLDYFYPRGGTAMLAAKLDEYIRNHGGEIRTSTRITGIDPEKKAVKDHTGSITGYRSLIWAADMKNLYSLIGTEGLVDRKLAAEVEARRSLLKDLRGGDSVYTVYLAVAEPREYFARISTGHFFYTPKSVGLSTVNREVIGPFLDGSAGPVDERMKERLKEYLADYCEYNTFEISIPVLRDPALAPEGMTGLIVSLLFDYRLARRIDELGWTAEIKAFLEEKFIEILDRTVFPGIGPKVVEHFSSTPLTIERLTGNTHGGITGWAFTNPVIPAVSKAMKIARSVETPIPSVWQAGQWVFSPSGLPIAILTGKLAADAVLKGK